MWLVSFAVTFAAEPAPPVVSAMHGRFAALMSARDAIVQGKLADAKSAIGPLTAPDPTEGFPTEWRPRVLRVEGAAQEVARAKDLAAAADGLARTAAACAECHDATGGGPKLLGTPDLPAPQWDPGQNMPLHQWASDWMFVGLLANSDEAWQRGAEELDARPLALRFDQAPPTSGQRELEQLVYVLANKALTTDAPAARAELYGDLLGTCAQCHLHRGAKP